MMVGRQIQIAAVVALSTKCQPPMLCNFQNVVTVACSQQLLEINR
jgi:hypothetical protein